MGRRIKREIFDEFIMGLTGRDALFFLNKISETQSKLIKSLSEGKLTDVGKIQAELSAYPIRYRIIYKGFFDGADLAMLNKNLEERGERPLYSRDFIEATLIWVFKKGLSFEEWKELIEKLKSLEGTGLFDELLINGVNGSYSAFPLERIKSYVKSASFVSGDIEYTIARTKTAEQSLLTLDTDREFILYISENIRNFCEGREKARYYICKYLCLYLSTQIDYYMLEGISRTAKRNIYLDLPLSGISEMDPNRHAKLTAEEVEKCLAKAKLSPNKLFEIMNRFYCYALLSESDAENPNWEEYSLVSKLLRGDGISRNMLMLTVLFFGCNSKISDEGMRLDTERINDILRACRFEELDEKNGQTDELVMKVLKSDDPRLAIERLIYEEDNFSPQI